jgi:hypothetical protein
MKKSKSGTIKIVCQYCGYTWETKSKMYMPTCPSCRRPTPNPLYQKQEKEQTIQMEHFNLSENGVKILDRSIPWVVDVYFTPDKVWCDYCKSEKCRHVEFALNLKDVQNILKKKGWKLKDLLP